MTIACLYIQEERLEKHKAMSISSSFKTLQRRPAQVRQYKLFLKIQNQEKYKLKCWMVFVCVFPSAGRKCTSVSLQSE